MAGSPMFAARLLKTATFTLAQVKRLFEVGSIPVNRLEGDTAGKLPIGQGAGEVAWKTVSGDATIDQNGVVTISAGSVQPDDMSLTGQAATNLAENDLCYISSITAGGVRILSLADADAAGKQATWVATGTILSGASGTFRKSYTSSATLNTNAGNVGDPVYLTTTGTTTNTWTLTPPAAKNAIIEIAGHIRVKSATVGVIAWDLLSPSTTSIGTNELNAEAVTLPKMERRTSGGVIIGQGAGGDVQEHTLSGDVTMDGTGAVTIGAAKVTVAKAGGFFSTEVTGTGAPQNVAHGLTGTPKFLCVPSVSAAGVSIAAQSADATNITLTMAGTDKCFIFAWV